MKLLKKENWWIWLLLFIFSDATSTIALGALLDVFEKDSWYAKWKNWLIGAVLILPIMVMVIVFNIEITSKTAAKLGVKGSELYLSPYIWIILIIIPILGWVLFAMLILYLNITILIALYRGEAEKYIN